MKNINIYLNFDGNCAEAMKFYAKCLGGDVQMSLYSEAPPGGGIPPGAENRILHARLTKGDLIIMASDCPPEHPLKMGDNFAISIATESVAETDNLFKAIGEKGKVIMPLADQFWGAYFGMVTDQFGINWMFNFEKSQK